MRAQALNMKQISLLTILRKDLKLIPYKCHTVQQLSNPDKTARLGNVPTVSNDNYWIKNAWFAGEALFYLNGIINSQNCRI